jgi:negative regulator of replication initiation
MTGVTLPPATNDGLDPSSLPRMPFWHMTNTDEGRSIIVQQVLDGFRQRSVGGDIAAI